MKEITQCLNCKLVQFRTKRNECRRCDTILPAQALVPQIESRLPTSQVLPQDPHCPMPYSMIRPLEETIRHAIFEAMAGCEGNVALTAKCLKVGKATLYRYLNKWGRQSEPHS